MAQGIILCHRQIGKAQKARPGKYTALHPQQHLTTVGSGQFRNLQSGIGFIGPEHPHRRSALTAALNGDIPALPVQFHPSRHGTAGPGGEALLIRKGSFGCFSPGIQPVEHGHQKGAPCGFAPFIGSLDDIQPRLERQGFVLQLAEGGSHGIDLHGRRTSCPSSICREIRAASISVSRVSASAPLMASFKMRK